MNRIPTSLAAIAFLSTTVSAFAADPAPAGDLRRQAMGLMQLCKADVQKLCGSVEAGGGRKLACLNDHKADVTSECRDALPKLDAMQAAATKRAAAPK